MSCSRWRAGGDSTARGCWLGLVRVRAGGVGAGRTVDVVSGPSEAQADARSRARRSPALVSARARGHLGGQRLGARTAGVDRRRCCWLRAGMRRGGPDRRPRPPRRGPGGSTVIKLLVARPRPRGRAPSGRLRLQLPLRPRDPGGGSWVRCCSPCARSPAQAPTFALAACGCGLIVVAVCRRGSCSGSTIRATWWPEPCSAAAGRYICGDARASTRHAATRGEGATRRPAPARPADDEARPRDRLAGPRPGAGADHDGRQLLAAVARDRRPAGAGGRAKGAGGRRPRGARADDRRDHDQRAGQAARTTPPPGALRAPRADTDAAFTVVPLRPQRRGVRVRDRGRRGAAGARAGARPVGGGGRVLAGPHRRALPQ